jgi:hypothetical protein
MNLDSLDIEPRRQVCAGAASPGRACAPPTAKHISADRTSDDQARLIASKVRGQHQIMVIGGLPLLAFVPPLDDRAGQLLGPLFMKIAGPVATGTPPSAAAVTVTSAGSGCADDSSRISGLARVAPLLKFLPGRAPAESLAAGWVRRRHRITVIDATGAP